MDLTINKSPSSIASNFGEIMNLVCDEARLIFQESTRIRGYAEVEHPFITSSGAFLIDNLSTTLIDDEYQMIKDVHTKPIKVEMVNNVYIHFGMNPKRKIFIETEEGPIRIHDILFKYVACKKMGMFSAIDDISYTILTLPIRYNSALVPIKLFTCVINTPLNGESFSVKMRKRYEAGKFMKDGTPNPDLMTYVEDLNGNRPPPIIKMEEASIFTPTLDYASLIRNEALVVQAMEMKDNPDIRTINH